jgi:hypothetical protein
MDGLKQADKMVNKLILSSYAILLHFVLAVTLLRPDLVMAQHWRLGLPDRQQAIYADRLQAHYAARDRALINPQIAFIGDSHVQFMDTALLTGRVISYGIGGDRLSEIPERIARYKALKGADILVLWAGYNDLKAAGSDKAIASFRSVQTERSSNQSLIVLSVPPATLNYAQEISDFNTRLAKECAENCRFVNVHSVLSDERGTLLPSFDSGDGLHLNAKGYALVADALNAALALETEK